MRGIPAIPRRDRRHRRISPAHAGNTCWWWCSWFLSSDQPRTCGEYVNLTRTSECGLGSAPHMRGIPRWSWPRAVAARISPAHAGNTGGDCAGAITCADQPRTCGEYVIHRPRCSARCGSAPHMRGIRNPPPIAPAPADQPRTCGEYRMRCQPSRRRWGSAPHMRGIPAFLLRQNAGRRISPAHAGNTLCSGAEVLSYADQPRTCGEYCGPSTAMPSSAGSAPHMRGIRPRRKPQLPPRRISPAHAGNTRRHGANPRRGSDQPRTCGEYRIMGGLGLPKLGSAPHMRGIPSPLPAYERRLGISPAHAGNTAR